MTLPPLSSDDLKGTPFLEKALSDLSTPSVASWPSPGIPAPSEVQRGSWEVAGQRQAQRDGCRLPEVPSLPTISEKQCYPGANSSADRSLHLQCFMIEENYSFGDKSKFSMDRESRRRTPTCACAWNSYRGCILSCCLHVFPGRKMRLKEGK